MSTQLVIDFKAVAYARFYYLSQDGLLRHFKPSTYSVHGTLIESGVYAIPLLPEYPHETQLERARRLGILDVWSPHCSLYLRNNHSLRFTGSKAVKVWKQYNAHIFGGKK